jgi:thioredoxin reductase
MSPRNSIQQAVALWQLHRQMMVIHNTQQLRQQRQHQQQLQQHQQMGHYHHY